MCNKIKTTRLGVAHTLMCGLGSIVCEKSPRIDVWRCVDQRVVSGKLKRPSFKEGQKITRFCRVVSKGPDGRKLFAPCGRCVQ